MTTHILSGIYDFTKGGKIALIGAGEAAKVFIQWSQCQHFDIYTTDGEGMFLGKKIMPVNLLESNANYSQVVIASQYVNEIVKDLLALGWGLDRLNWFDYLLKVLAPLNDMGFIAEPSTSRLYAVYDLEVYPPNYEIAIFLARAELYRKEMGLDTITLLIVEGSFGGVSARGVLSHGIESAQWRLQHVLIPMGQLLPSCEQVLHITDKVFLHSVCNNKPTYPPNINQRLNPRNFALGPLRQGFYAGEEVRPFVASAQAKRYVSQFLQTQKLLKPFITISLREYSYQDTRNSCLDLYQEISLIAIARGIDVILIRDTHKALDIALEWDGVVEFPVASYDLAIRMAVYERAMLNVSVSSGPSWGLMLLSPNIDFVLTHPIDESHRSASEAFLESSQGIVKGEQYPFSSQFQQLCWHTDEYEIKQEIQNVLDEMSYFCLI